MKPCCQEPENLEVQEPEEDQREDIVIRRCKVCGCRHLELTVDPGHVGIYVGEP